MDINAETISNLFFLTFIFNIHAVNFYFLFQLNAYNMLKYIYLSLIASYIDLFQLPT
jgi:hypothetical protein